MEYVLESCTYDGQREKERAETVETETLSFARSGYGDPSRWKNVPKRASSPTSGHTSALEESIVKYKKRVTKLEIENEDLRIDVRTLHTDKSLILHSFAKLQAQYGQVIGRLEIFEQFHKEKQEVSGGKSGDTTANMTKFEPIELPRDLSDK